VKTKRREQADLRKALSVTAMETGRLSSIDSRYTYTMWTHAQAAWPTDRQTQRSRTARHSDHGQPDTAITDRQTQRSRTATCIDSLVPRPLLSLSLTLRPFLCPSPDRTRAPAGGDTSSSGGRAAPTPPPPHPHPQLFLLHPNVAAFADCGKHGALPSGEGLALSGATRREMAGSRAPCDGRWLRGRV